MKQISIVYITDNRFCLLTRTSINSVIKNSNPNFLYSIYVVCVNVFQTEIDAFRDMSTSNVCIKIIETDNSYDKIGQKKFRVSKASLFKFQIPNLILNVDKVLYLDGDTIIQSDLVEFFNTDIKDKYAAVVRDWFAEIQNKDHERIKHEHYFNSGVMLLNLKKMRENNVSEKLLIWKINDKWQKYMDQDALNVVFDENVVYVSEKYNFHNIYYNYREDNEKYFGLKSIDHIDIFHFTDKKPDVYTNIARKEIFYRYVLPQDINLITFNYINFMLFDNLNAIKRDIVQKIEDLKNKKIKLVSVIKKDDLIKYLFLGIRLLRIVHRENKYKVYLFGIPVYERKLKENKTIKIENVQCRSLSNFLSNGIIKVAVFESGGLGDSILSVNFLKELYLQSSNNIEIDCFYRFKELLNGMPFIKNIFDYDSNIENYYNKYDIIFYVNRFFIVKHINNDKVQNLSPRLFEYCNTSINIEKMFSSNINPRSFNEWSLLENRNRYEQMAIGNFPEYNRESLSFMPININSEKVLKKYNLYNQRYVTLSHSVDGIYNSKHPKLWPLTYFEILINLIKQKYPDIKFVQLGSNQEYGIIKNVDVNLVGKTNFEQLKVILKHSILHIDSEGGLVHLKHSLNGISAVIFGPTEKKVFAYDENINFEPTVCGGCEWLNSFWIRSCLKGYNIPVCMSSTSPQVVAKKVCDYLKTIKSYKLEVLSKIPEISENVLFVGEKPIAIKLNIKKAISFSKSPFVSDSFLNIKNVYKNFGDVENIPSKNNNFDAVICREKNISKTALFELVRITKVNGIIFVDGKWLKKCE